MRSAKPNPALIVTIALPLFAVVASVGTAVVAFSRGDPPLPGQYHWEGDKLDHDFAQSRHATDLHVEASVDLRPADGVCHLMLALDGARPSEVELALIHGSNPKLDRDLRFALTASSSQYVAPCKPLPTAHWQLELSDRSHTWSFRSSAVWPQPAALILSTRSSGNTSWP